MNQHIFTSNYISREA